MRAKLSKAFDESLARIKKGEAVKACLGEYPPLRQQLVPLLHTAFSIGAVPKVTASDDFRKLSKGRLMARLRESCIQAEKSRQAKSAYHGLGVLWRGLERAITGPGKVAIPVTLALLLALQSLFIFGKLDFMLPSPTLASQATLSVLTGGVELQSRGSSTWEEAENGMTVAAGSRLKTAPNSQALLTFFEGTTIKLEPTTDLVVEQVEGGGENQPLVIVLKQRVGKTWSRVEKLVDPGSHYEIQTPSAAILVRGTLFVTEVDETGATRVQTIEGLVGVTAQGQEVYLPAGQQTAVEPGAPPSEPMPIGPTEGEGPPGQSKQGTPAQGPDDEVPPGQSKQGTTPAQGPDDELTPGQSKQGAPVQGPDDEGLPGQSKQGTPTQGQSSGQDPAMREGQGIGQGQRDLRAWVICGVILLLWGVAVLIISKRRSPMTSDRRRRRDWTRSGR